MSSPQLSVIQFHMFKGNLDDIIKETASYADLIVEGGSGSNPGPLVNFREFGFTVPYIRMDLLHRGYSLDEPQSFTTSEGLELTNFWSYHGNCFRKESLLPVFDKFHPKYPVFATDTALSNALFDRKKLNLFDRKRDEDFIPIPQAVSLLSELYKAQIHIQPAGFALIASPHYIAGQKEEELAPRVELDGKFTDLVVLNHEGSTRGLENFLTFVQESTKAGWQLYLPTDTVDVLYMKK